MCLRKPWFFVVVPVLLLGQSQLALAASAYTQSDLAGTWESHSFWAGPRAPFWDRGPITVDAQGIYNFAIEQFNGNTESGSGQFEIDSSGRIGFVGEPGRLYMAANKNIIAQVETVEDSGNDNGVLRLFIKRGSGYQASDLAGTWQAHMIEAGPWAPFWTQGPLEVGSSGSYTFNMTSSDGSTESDAGQLQVGADGLVTRSQAPDWRGFMSADKSLIVTVGTDENDMPDVSDDSAVLQVFTKTGTNYQQADLTGVWQSQFLWVGPRSPFWDRGPMTIDNSGVCSFQFEQYNGNWETGSGQMQIDASGLVTQSGDSNWRAHMSADKSFMVSVGTVTDNTVDNGVIQIFTKQANSEHFKQFKDYAPLDPNDYGVKTYVGTHGTQQEYVSRISGTETVDYGSGSLTGTVWTNTAFWDDQPSNRILYDDGFRVRWLGVGDYYLSADAALGAPAAAYAWGPIVDGIIESEHLFLVKKDQSEWEEDTGINCLFDIQDVNVLQGDYPNAIITWAIDINYPFTNLNLAGKETDLGIDLPTAADTGGYSITEFEIWGRNTGIIAWGDISAESGQLEQLVELQAIESESSDTVADHIMKIELATSYDYGDGTRTSPIYEFNASLQVDDMVTSVTMSGPDGANYALGQVEYGEETWFGFYEYSVDSSILQKFASGTFTFTINYGDGSSHITVAEYQLPDGSPISPVTQKPSLLVPISGATEVPTSLTWQFEAAQDPNWSLGLDWRSLNGTGLGGQWHSLDSSVESYGPTLLSGDTEYEVEMTINHGVRTQNPDGILLGMDKDAEVVINFTTGPATVLLHDWNGDGILSIIGDVPGFVEAVYFNTYPDGWSQEKLLAVGDSNGDGILSIIGDVPGFVDCVYFGNCPE